MTIAKNQKENVGTIATTHGHTIPVVGVEKILELRSKMQSLTIEQLNSTKNWLISELKKMEPDDGEEICLYTEKVIHKWIDVLFDNEAYDIEMKIKSRPKKEK